jgi:tetratricopeptide (TPR) repeat protein
MIPLLVRLYHPSQLSGDAERDLAAPPLLAIRLARRAIAANPEDASAYLRLGQAYLALHNLVGERSPARTLVLLDELRHVQTATTLQQARIADPQQATAHQLLANLFHERGYLDAALDHRREELRLARRHRLRQTEESPERESRLQNLIHQVEELEQTVQNAHKAWTLSVRTHSTPNPVADAESALRYGLAQTALDEVLAPAPQELLGGKGVQLACLLQLQLGRGEQIRDLLLGGDAKEHKQNLGYLQIAAPALPGYAPAYHLLAYDWLLLLLAAATGDYDQAHNQIHELIEPAQTQQQRRLQLVQHRLPVVLTSELGLSASPFAPLPWLAPRIERSEALPLVMQARFLEHEVSDLNVLGALLALEQGAPRQAENYLRRALEERPARPDTPGVFAGRAFAETYLRRIQEGARR